MPDAEHASEFSEPLPETKGVVEDRVHARDITTAGVDPVYFDASLPWRSRLESILQREIFRSSFKQANAHLVPSILDAEQPGLRAVINMGAGSLCSFLEEGRYKNAYDRPRIDGVEIGPSERRQQVDELLFGSDMQSFYFASVSLGGTGCRFYGEYCVVLRRDRAIDAQVFDRNSYDLLSPPLSSIESRSYFVDALRGGWRSDITSMLTAKVAPELPEENRLTTPGQVSDLVSRDEDFAEVHLQGDVTIDHIEEVRTSPEDTSVATETLDAYGDGEIPDPALVVWATWRKRVAGALRTREIRARVISVTGRGFRWR